MLESESNPGFFQTVAERIAALAKQPIDDEKLVAEGPIEVSLLTLEDRVLYSAVPVPVDLIVQVDAIDASIADASATLFEPAEPVFAYHAPDVDSGFDLAKSGGYDDSESHDNQQDLHGEYSTDGVAEVDFSDVEFLDVNLFDVDHALLTLEAATPTVTRELVVVDRGVEDYQQLVDDLISSGSHDRIFEIIYLDESTSGIETLSSELSDRVDRGDAPFDSLHLISHGSDGTIQLGSDRLNFGNVNQFEDALAIWGAALTVDADLLIYGCDVAESEEGQDLVDSLASLTGADVAASDDITGHDSLGGDWDFEYTVGLVESEVAFSQTVQQNWEQSLATHTVVADNGGQAKSIGVDGAGRTTIVTSVEDGGVTDGRDIFMRFTDQFGNETIDIPVNETLVGDQLHASVAVAENGSKAIVWTSVSTSGEQALFAKFYDGNNSVVQSEFRVDVPATGVKAGDSSIAIDDAGNVVIVWESSDSGVSEILARRYSVDGSPVGSVFNVGGSGFAGSDDSANPFVAMNGSGQFVVVWDTHDGSDNDISAIYARTFNADGTAHSTVEQVERRDDFQLTQASADIDSSGNFVVSYTLNDLQDNDDLDIRAESFTFDAYVRHRTFGLRRI